MPLDKRYITVSTLNSYLKRKIDNDTQLQRVFIKGEISNLKRNISSGHLYFTLKDGRSHINAIMYKGFADQLNYDVKNGDSVLIEATVSVYAVTGYNQLIVKNIEPDGLGSLFLKFENLKKTLLQEGLFDENHKKNIPSYPSKIAVLSAYPSAALMDVMRTLKERFPVCRVIVFPIPVQGKNAYLKIISTLKFVDELHFNTIILARGGGSLEDLWNFNEEALARTIYELNTPIICGIGHETDFTICDYVCDLRALTPTYAAIEATPHIEDMYKHLDILNNLLKSNMTYKLETLNAKLKQLNQFYLFKNPEKLYGDHMQYVVYLQDKINHLMDKHLHTNKMIFTKYNLQMQSQKKLFVNHYNQRIQTYQNLLKINFNNKLKENQSHLSILISKLNALSPLQTLERGYALVKKDEQYISSIKDLNNADTVSIYLKDGNVKATIHKE
nr:exodeoxyribonuclease VII large subunit [uncultured Faecalibacillus sp.]